MLTFRVEFTTFSLGWSSEGKQASKAQCCSGSLRFCHAPWIQPPSLTLDQDLEPSRILRRRLHYRQGQAPRGTPSRLPGAGRAFRWVAMPIQFGGVAQRSGDFHDAGSSPVSPNSVPSALEDAPRVPAFRTGNDSALKTDETAFRRQGACCLERGRKRANGTVKPKAG